MEQCNLEHNHEMLTNRPEALPDDIASTVRAMLSVGVPKALVLAFVHETTGRCLSRQELSSGFGAESVPVLRVESAELIANVEADGGICHVYDLPDGDDFARADVFTLTQEESMNLTRFGDVLFLDGTAIRNAMGWATVPVTLVDDCKEIISGGLLFTAFEREEIYVWFLATLSRILEDKRRTIFSDEDSALGPAVVHLRLDRPEIAHR
jgi:hypothetical protein